MQSADRGNDKWRIVGGDLGENPQLERHLPPLDKWCDRWIGGALGHRHILRALRLRQIAGLIEAEIDISPLITPLEFPGLHPGADHCDLIRGFVDVIAAGLQSLFPDADATDRDKDRGQICLHRLLFLDTTASPLELVNTVF